MAWHPRVSDGMTWDGTSFTDTNFLATTVGCVVEKATGLIDQPPSRVTNRNRTAAAGARFGLLQLGPRPFTLEGMVFASSDTDLDTRTAALMNLLVMDGAAHTLGYIHRSQGAQQVTARVEQELALGDPFGLGNTGPNVGIAWQVGMVSVDPRRYAANLQSVSTSSITTAGGLAFPMSFPMSFGTGATGGVASIPASAGNTNRPTTIQIFGPVTNPIVEDVAGRGALNFGANGGLVLSATDYIIVDLQEQTALLNGDPLQNVYGYIDFTQSNFWIPPKDAWSLRLRGSVISDPAVAVVAWRDAFI